MASIETRTSTSGIKRLVVRWRESGRDSRYRSKTFPATREGSKDAKAFAAAVERQQRLGLLAADVIGSDQTLHRFIVDDFWPKYAVPRLASSTRASYEYVLDRWVIRYLGDLRLRDITRETLDGWMAAVTRDGAGAPTVNRAAAILQGVLRRAVEWRRIPASPAAQLPKVKHRRSDEIRARTAEEVEAIRARLGRQDAALVSVLAYVGLRPAETFALRWRDVLDEKGRPRARLFAAGTKTARARRHPELPAPVGLELRELHLAVGKPKDGLVFPSASGGPLSQQNWRNRVWLPALAGDPEHGVPKLERFRVYDLRHTAATLMIYAGRTPGELAKQLGHADPGFTLKTYTHIYDDARGKRIPIDQAINQARAAAQRERSA